MRTYGAKNLTEDQKALLSDSAIDRDYYALEGVNFTNITEYSELPGPLKENISKKNFEHDAPFLLTHLVGYEGITGNEYDAFQMRSYRFNGDEALAKTAVTHKALQGGKGSHIVTTPFMAKRFKEHKKVGKKFRLLIQEGTRQGVVASQYAAPFEDLVVIIIWGCTNFASGRDDGTTHPALARFMACASEVIISLDGDRLTNLSVWKGADNLATEAEANGLTRGKNIKYISLPSTRSGDRKAGLDDVLGSTAKSLRANKFKNLIEKATTKAGRRPAENKKAGPAKATLVPIVDWDEAQIREADRVHENGGVDKGDVLAGFAARIIETRSEIEDLRPGARPKVTHDIEFRFPNGLTTLVEDWPDTDMEKMGDLLAAAAPGGLGTTLEYTPEPATIRKIAAAIRAHNSDTRTYRSILDRTGMTTLPDGHVAWVFEGGAMTAQGVNRTASAKLDEKYRGRLVLVDATDEEYADAVRLLHKTVEESFVDPTPFWAVWQAQVAAATGLEPTGTLTLVGRTSSGKTATLADAASAYGVFFAYRNKQFLGESLRNGTPGFWNRAGKGLHQCAMVLDDARLVSNHNDRQKIISVLQTHLSMGMGDSPRGRLVSDGRGRHTTYIDSYDKPWRMLTAETITNLEFIESDLNRMISIEVTKENSFVEGGADAMHRLAEDGVMNVAFSGFVKWMLDPQSISLPSKADGTPDGFWKATTSNIKAGARQIRTALLDALLYREADLNFASKRQYEVLAGHLTGAKIWTWYVATVAPDLKAFQWYGKHQKAMIEAAKKHDRAVRAAGADERQSILERTIALVASQRAVLIENEGTGTMFENNKPVIGARSAGPVLDPRSGMKVDAVYLNHAAIASLLGETVAAVRSGLEEVVIPAPTTKGWRTVIRGARVQVLCIPAYVWDADGDELPANAEVLGSIPDRVPVAV